MFNIVQDRLNQFGEKYEDLAPAVVGELVKSAGEFLEYLVGQQAANEAMSSLMRTALGIELENPEEWRLQWEALGLSDLARLVGSENFTNLYAYAFFGLPTTYDRSLDERGLSILGHCTSADMFLESCPRTWADVGVLERTLEAAQTRWAIDAGVDGTLVGPEGLAAIAGVSLKSIKNILAPSSGSDLRTTENGQVRVEDARRWLEGRPGFLPSIWELDEAGSVVPASTADHMLDDVLFVPVAKDGSHFSPECLVGKHYQIGPKSAPQKIADFRLALDLLTRMEPPRWRRPNSKGVPGLVTGVTWTRKTAAELGL
ncbi:hypothetical protein FRZ44_02200 [Hypericibacter terrae]|uniref:Uncharacterized protein n=1 Tax=Hypericibacter terrae TaxID=2602015 RepID=A0A5J6MCD6_9PROT|nr:hypothetical protein [Hypericibacter terrae]QEX14944.1 hypothetical protein FRZ44_02200 [Hypericibacter terrae]